MLLNCEIKFFYFFYFPVCVVQKDCPKCINITFIINNNFVSTIARDTHIKHRERSLYQFTIHEKHIINQFSCRYLLA